MTCYVRLMRREDIPQVSAIDREAFPTQWPSPNFQHELRNRLSHYIVACDGDKTAEPPRIVKSQNGPAGLVSRLSHWLGLNRFSGDGSSAQGGHYVTGFIGFWSLADEAHITTIAIREALQRQGIGEMLLISTIDMARELKVSVVTLEVRVSNTGAQSLYAKYGFNRTGIRKAYYTDNREDAVVMTTDDINSAQFQTKFKQLKRAHRQRWGIDAYRVSR